MNENNSTTGENNIGEHNTLGMQQKIIVIGASSGGFEAFKTIVKALPPNFNASIFIVWHMSPDIPGILPTVLNRQNTIYAAHAYDKEEIVPNRIYIAPPDHHLLVENATVRVTHGPKENRFRPAIDPLFRSAAYTFGTRVIGVVLSGALDDGTAGLWTIKHYGGITVVQDPMDAEVPSMPENALREVEVDYCVAVSDLAPLLVRLSQEKSAENFLVMKDKQTEKEIAVAAGDNALKKGLFQMGELSPYACPECHGVLSKLKNGNITRFRCHTGHSYSADALMAAITERIEDSLYNAIRGMDESIMLLNHIGDHFAEINNPKLAAMYFQKAKEAEARSQLVQKAALNNVQLDKDKILHEAEEEEKEGVES